MTSSDRKLRIIGMALVLFGATLWGVSGKVAQYLFQEWHYFGVLLHRLL
nr:hypothetical protein [Anaerobacillus arseniciselenatis]